MFRALTSPLPLRLEWRLAATAFFLWLVGNCFQARIGVAVEAFRLLLDVPYWQPQWPLGPWLLASAGLGIVYARQRRGRLGAELRRELAGRLRRLSLLAGALLLLRLASLAPPVSGLFPYLTLLWAPHATWALAAAFLLYPAAPLLPQYPLRAMALGVLLVSGLAFSLWTLYFCQTTMLHGDEAHYLRVTQSLLRDGDMDLSNNLDANHVGEFHIINFAPHQAPGSPPGKIHSVHPIGLSALLLPAYWAGLHLWSNPRLACSLAIAWCSAGVVALVFLWLVRLGFGPWLALACSAMAATTTPLFLFTTQLYPDVPALAIALVFLVALAHWQVPGGQYRSLGPREPQLLAGLAALLVALLFLHPRYLPLALFLAAGVYLQARKSPDPRASGRWVGPVAAVGALLLVAYNFAYSNDLFGPFLPGNAWEKGALQGATWMLSLPGQWLHDTTGLLNSSPFFFASPLGLALLFCRRDPRLWGALAFYLVTAGVNGLHPDWTFGFCMPARFLVTALPLLLWGLALFLREYGGRLPLVFALLLALALAHDTVGTILGFPEQAFGGNHLSVRDLNEYYPLNVHFFTETAGAPPVAALLFWGLLGGAAGAALWPALAPPWRRGALLAAGLLPLVWGQAGALAEQFKVEVSPYMVRLDPAGKFSPDAQHFINPVQSLYQTTTGQPTPAGGYRAEAPGHRAGILRSFYGPLVQPGTITYALTDVQASNAPGQVAGHFAVARRWVLPAVAAWGIYSAYPLAAGSVQGRNPRLAFHADRTSLAYVYVEFAGAGSLEFSEAESRFMPIHLNARLEEVRRFAGGEADREHPSLGFRCENLPRGYYLARYQLRGRAFSTFFERKPVPVHLGVYAAQNGPPDHPSLEAQVGRWFNQGFAFQDAAARPDFVRPLVESIQAPWWTALPLVGASAYEFEFGLDRDQEVWLVFDYGGDTGLSLEEIALYRLELTPPPWTGQLSATGTGPRTSPPGSPRSSPPPGPRR
jgi:hypothetical protein